MKVLLDTNIVIHREAVTVVNEDIGVLFWWLDNLKFSKYLHPLTVNELQKHKDPKIQKSLTTKLANYNILKVKAPLAPKLRQICEPMDKDENDTNDTLIINELYCGRVDALITEDRNLHIKGSMLGVADRVFSIDAFLEKVTIENPELTDYKVLSVRRDYLGNLDITDKFFESFIEDYPGYEKWFNQKANDAVYVCRSGDKPVALLLLKVEEESEDYSDINPPFAKKKRLKICTFKVTSNGFRLGERFLKIVFDNALRFRVAEIYVTIFDKRVGQRRLINLLEEYGFRHHGYKKGDGGNELVFVRPFSKLADRSNPKLAYPYFSLSGRIFLVAIYPRYHTELFPDSILKTESPDDFIDNEPHRNAIGKVFISRSVERGLEAGDVIVFYRTKDQRCGYYESVVTTIGVVESIITNIANEGDFIRLCRKRSVFTDQELLEHWNYRPSNRPFIVNFLYTYSFPKRINLKRLMEMGIIPSIYDAPRGFMPITVGNLRNILTECQANDSIAID